ncbi:MAG TPA: T9SS type A sorting domain-containing protein [candidate division Zixibacteria bacterium]|nr:T9SS type A sorting domain-containing protein [candidate division Zixibacteria bacterium]
MRRAVILLSLIAILFMAGGAFGLSYFYMTIDGDPATEQIQGQEQFLHADCEPLGSIDVYYFLDINENGVVDDGEPVVFMMDFYDNEDEFPPDMDPTEGAMEILWPLHMPPGHYVIRGVEGDDVLEFPYQVHAPDPLLHSVSGRLIFEGIDPPDASIANYPFVIGTFDPPILMYAMTDEWGDFSVNWPGEPDTLVALFIADVPGYDLPEDMTTTIYVDGHVTDWEILIESAGPGMSYFYMNVDGEPATEQIQGQEQFIIANCEPLGVISVEYYLDLNSNGHIEHGEPLMMYVQLHDNGTDFPPDLNPTEGEIEINWPLNMPPGDYVIRGSDGERSIQFPYTVHAPDPLLHSISGRLIFEDIDPPDDRLANYMFFIGTIDPPILMYAITDEWGDYSVNWPGDPAMVLALFVMEVPGYVAPEMEMIFVDGHITDWDLEFLLGSPGGLSNLRMSVGGIDVTDSSVQTQGVGYSFRVHCEEWGHVNWEFYVDTDGDGEIGPWDRNFFERTFYTQDNEWIDDWWVDREDELGKIAIWPSFHLPPGNYILRAFDDVSELHHPFVVVPPDPVEMSVSGRVIMETVEPPDPMLDGLVVYLYSHDRRELIYSYTDDMGNFTCNWTYDPGNAILGIESPYPSEDWNFRDAYLAIDVDGIITGANLFVPYTSFDDSIRITFECDPEGLWEVAPHEVMVEYIDPATREVFTSIVFPEDEFFIPVRSPEYGLVFTGSHEYLLEHNFVSPWETLWVSPDDYPEAIHVYVSQCCYHFKLGLEGFDLDSVPDEGITYDLYGEGPDRQSYYSEATMFIQHVGGEYIVAGGREMAPATWRAVLRTPLPSGYIPEVTETTFVIPRVDTWPHMLIKIPVSFENISEAELPEDLSLNVYPNPFNATVTIDFRVAEPGEVSIEVFDMMGKRITTLGGNADSKGAFRARWDARDHRGEEVPTGVYLFKVSTPTETRIVKGMYLK